MEISHNKERKIHRKLQRCKNIVKNDVNVVFRDEPQQVSSFTGNTIIQINSFSLVLVVYLYLQCWTLNWLGIGKAPQ